jgi:bifunctional nuclease
MRSLCNLVVVCGLVGAMTVLPNRAQCADSDRSVASIRVESVHVAMSQVGPVVLLRVANKAIPIFVDIIVAESIQGALSGEKPARPLTHDLMHAESRGEICGKPLPGNDDIAKFVVCSDLPKRKSRLPSGVPGEKSCYRNKHNKNPSATRVGP